MPVTPINPPRFNEIDLNLDGVADYAEIAGWVLGRQSEDDIKSLRGYHCLPEHHDPNDRWAKYENVSNTELSSEQKQRFHTLIQNYCFPMVHYPLRNRDGSIMNDPFGMVYPTTRTETLGNKGAHSVSPEAFEDRMVDMQFNKKLDVYDVVYHFIYANKGYDFSGDSRFPDPYVGYRGEANGYGGFNKAQWDALFSCTP